MRAISFINYSGQHPWHGGGGDITFVRFSKHYEVCWNMFYLPHGLTSRSPLRAAGLGGVHGGAAREAELPPVRVGGLTDKYTTIPCQSCTCWPLGSLPLCLFTNAAAACIVAVFHVRWPTCICRLPYRFDIIIIIMFNFMCYALCYVCYVMYYVCFVLL